MRSQTPESYYSQMGEDKFVDQEIFHGLNNGVFIDIGAHDGVTFSNTYFLEKYRNWTGICVEPLPKIYKKLKKNRKAISINACIGENEDRQDFLEVSGEGNAEMFSGLYNSFDKRQLDNIHQEVKKRSGKVKVTKVKTLPLSTVLKKNNINHVNYCSIDTEGNELEVLKSIDFTTCVIDCMTVEELFFDQKLRNFLKEKGYRIVKKLDKDLVCIHKSFRIGELDKKISRSTSVKVANISVVIHTKNEATNIEACINSVKKLADEVIVADMNSSDKTVELAKRLGAVTLSVPDYGFADPARNMALAKATGDWILVLDADERLTPALVKTITKIISSDICDVASFPRKNIMLGKWIRHGLRWPDYQIRLFRKGFASWSDKIHDPAHFTGRFYALPAKPSNALIHHHSDSIKYLMDKTYLQASLERFYENQKKLDIETIYNRMEREFPWRFYEHEGFKDGMHGLIVNKFMQFYRFLEFAMYWEGAGKPKITNSEILQNIWRSDETLNNSLEELKRIKDSKFFIFWKLYSYLKDVIKGLLRRK